MEVEFTGIIGLMLAGFLTIVTIIIGVWKPKVLERPLFREEEEYLSSESIEQTIKSVLIEHCPKIQEESMRQTNSQIQLALAETLGAFRSTFVEWKGGVDAKLQSFNGEDSKLREDIRQLRKEISSLRQELLKLR